jgi:predicted regulator of Ras-like GTPase activity (Roadblock/LC7/MglB family)
MNGATTVPVPSATPPPAIFVELSLKRLWSKLNPEVLQAAARHPEDDSYLRLPLPLLQAQLAKGAFKMPFAQLRQYSPSGLFPVNPDHDLIEVEIPISEVLPLIKPEHFARRPNQKKIEVPNDIGPIFGPDGGPAHGLKISEQKPRKPAQTPTPLSSIPTAPFKRADQPAAPIPVKAAPAAVPPPKAAPIKAPAMPNMAHPSAPPEYTLTPSRPVPAPAASSPFPAASTVEEEIPDLDSVPIAPVGLPPAALRNDPIPAPKLDPSLATLRPKAPVAPPIPTPPLPAPAPAPVAPAAPVAPVAPIAVAPAPAPAAPQPAPTQAPAPAAKPLEGTFMLPLMDVAAYWTEKGKADLANLYRHSLEIPLSTLENALKTGRLTFQWREIRPWLRLAPGNTLPNIADDLLVDLPLSIIAPRFMEHRGHAKAKNHEELTGDIPLVFEQKQGIVQNGASAPVLGAVSVAMENVTDLAPGKTGDTAFLKRTGGKPLLEFGEIFGQPEKKNWTLAEVAQKTMTLRGVAGAIIATSDGLLVAGSWPGGVKSDSVAAFVPQMFSRILQYTKELNIGEPGNFTLMIENTPLQVFKAGSSFFTVMGRSGENLPKAQLNAVAMRLGTTNK